MTKADLINAIKKGNDIMLKVGNRGFTILTWLDGGPDIGEWNKPDTVQQFSDVRSLVEEYMIDGLSLGDLAEQVTILEYS